MEDNELYHYGVLGMKWGVRRTPEQLGHKTTTKKNKVVIKKNDKSKDLNNALKASQQVSKDLGKVVKVIEERNRKSKEKAKGEAKSEKLKEATEMSTEELQKIIQRMSLEDQYSNLMANRMSTGKNYVDSILSGVGEGLSVVGSIFGILMSAKVLLGK